MPYNDPFSDSIALQRAKNSFYGNFGNPMPSTPAPDPNNTLTGNAGLPQKAPETDEAPPVQAQQDMVPVNKSQIPQNIPPNPGYQNPYKSQLEETEKLAPQYEEPSKGRKRVGNVLKVIGGLASLGAGPTAGGLINQGADYIEHEPYNKKIRAFSTDLQNQQRLADTDQKVTGGEATVNHLNAQAEAEKARRIAEEERGKALGKMADFKTNQENFDKIQETKLGVAGLNHSQPVQYTDGTGNKGVAKYDGKTGKFFNTDGDEIPDVKSAIPIKDVGNMSGEKGQIAVRIANLKRLGDPESLAQADRLEKSVKDVAIANGNDPEVKKQQALANVQHVKNETQQVAIKNADEAVIHGSVPSGVPVPGTTYTPKNATKALHYSSAIDNPEYLNDPEHFGKNAAMQTDASNRFTEITGLTPPNKGMNAKEADNERAALQSQSAANRIAIKLRDPALQAAVGPLKGQANNIEEAIGMASQVHPELTKQIQGLQSDFELLKLAEAKLASGGRGNNMILQQLSGVSPQMKFDPARSAGAIDSIKGNAARAIDAIQDLKYGSGKSMYTKVGDERIPTFRVNDGKVYKLNPETVKKGDMKNAYEFYTNLEK